MTARLGVTWSPRSEPLVPCACIAWGPVAHALGRAVLAWDATRLAKLKACAGDRLLVLLGERASLPWLDGITYLGRDEAAPHLLLPTNRRPDVPVGLFARALVAQLPEAAKAGAIVPGQAEGLLWVSIASAGPIEPESLEAWMVGP